MVTQGHAEGGMKRIGCEVNGSNHLFTSEWPSAKLNPQAPLAAAGGTVKSEDRPLDAPS